MKLTKLQKINIENLAYDTMNLAQYDEEMVVFQTEDFVAVNSRLPSYNFNMITPIEYVGKHAKEGLRQIIGAFNEQNLPFNIWCNPEDIKLTQFLQQLQLTEYDLTYKAMVLPLENYTVHNSSTIQIERVVSMEQLDQFVKILLTVYEEEIEQQAIKNYYRQLSEVLLHRCQSTQLFIGTFKGRAVTTGALTFKDQSVGLYHIATHPKSRGHGFATTMTEHLLDLAKRSEASYCSLQASPAAEGIYEGLGFQTVGTLKVFENKHLISM